MGAELGLTPTERALLFLACHEHAVARCPVCGHRYTRTQLGADLVGSRAYLCRTCRVDLTASIRDHLIACAAAALEAQELRRRGVELQDGVAEARKRSEVGAGARRSVRAGQ
jgi:hypothetical protein